MLPKFSSRAFLAPMAGVSDPALRLQCKPRLSTSPRISYTTLSGEDFMPPEPGERLCVDQLDVLVESPWQNTFFGVGNMPVMQLSKGSWVKLNFHGIDWQHELDGDHQISAHSVDIEGDMGTGTLFKGPLEGTLSGVSMEVRDGELTKFYLDRAQFSRNFKGQEVDQVHLLALIED